MAVNHPRYFQQGAAGGVCRRCRRSRRRPRGARHARPGSVRARHPLTPVPCRRGGFGARPSARGRRRAAAARRRRPPPRPAPGRAPRRPAPAVGPTGPAPPAGGSGSPPPPRPAPEPPPGHRRVHRGRQGLAVGDRGAEHGRGRGQRASVPAPGGSDARPAREPRSHDRRPRHVHARVGVAVRLVSASLPAQQRRPAGPTPRRRRGRVPSAASPPPRWPRNRCCSRRRMRSLRSSRSRRRAGRCVSRRSSQIRPARPGGTPRMPSHGAGPAGAGHVGVAAARRAAWSARGGAARDSTCQARSRRLLQARGARPGAGRCSRRSNASANAR